MLSQLVYLSIRNPDCSQELVSQILEVSQKNNSKTDITGALIYSQTKFLQVLEGEENQLIALFHKIKKDCRHSSILLLSSKPIEKRYFPSWQMASKEIDTQNYHFLTHMEEEEQIAFRSLISGKSHSSAARIIAKLFGE